MKKIPSLAALGEMVGEEVAVSGWSRIDQNRINQFADATGDHQWIHVDADRCLQQSGLGATIAHGFLTLSLISALMQEAIGIEGVHSALNYGLNKVRFPAPVPVDSRIRARFTLAAIEPAGESLQVTWAVILEREGESKPVCIADSLVRYFSAAA